MNIFVLDENPVTSAKMMCDKHVVKMIVESAQMLSTAHRYLDGDEFISYSKNGRRIKRWCHPTDTMDSNVRLYKSIMINHPCTKWTCETDTNYRWLARHALSLCEEYTFRYRKKHASQNLIWWLWDTPDNITIGDQTEFAQAMPDEYKVPKNAVEAYQAYYRGEKAGFAKWTTRETPEWFLTKDEDVVQCA